MLVNCDDVAIRAHLVSCDACGERHNDISTLALAASQWTEVDVPRWHQAFARPLAPRWPLFLQLGAFAASVLVLLLVTLQVRIDTDSGLGLRYGDAVAQEDLSALQQNLLYISQTSDSRIRDDLAALHVNQQAANQQLARSLIEASRLERREDLGYLLDLIEEGQAARDARTASQVAYLVREQRADRERLAVLLRALNSPDSVGGQNL